MKINVRTYRNNEELFVTLKEEYNNLDSLVIQKLVQSMFKRSADAIKN